MYPNKLHILIQILHIPLIFDIFISDIRGVVDSVA